MAGESGTSSDETWRLTGEPVKLGVGIAKIVRDRQRRCRERDIKDVQSAMTTGFEKGCRCCDGTESKSAWIVTV